MPKDKSVTPKATVTLASLGPGFSKENVRVGGTSTLKFKRNKLNTSLAFSDATIKNVKSLRDVVATVDYKLPKSVTLNGKYELGTKKYTGGATWDGTVGKKASTVKLAYSNKDKLVSGESTLSVAKNQKANVTFNQKQLLAAKYTWVKGAFTVEPSYSFAKQSQALAVTRKVGSKDTAKISYDVKSKGASVEYNHKPFKLVLSSVVKGRGIAKPTLAAQWENIYEF